MVVDYSKWDALELSDDSDIEVHPNVDKKSFIRAKQAQIHQQRAQRKHQIITLKYERIINDGMIERIDRLLTALKSHKPEASPNTGADELVFQALIESAGDPKDDQPPPPPQGVHQNVKDQPHYSKMIAVLVDQVRNEIQDDKESVNEFEAWVKGVTVHRDRIVGLNGELETKLKELELEEKKLITSDDYQTGFSYSSTNKDIDPPLPASASTSKSRTNATGPELLNPTRPAIKSINSAQSVGADADVEDATDDDENGMRASPEAKQFAKIPAGDYRASLDFISKHKSLLAESESDGLLVEAFDAQLEGKAKYAKQCVNQALLIQYCRQLGRDGVGLFFKRITTPGHQAAKLFTDDVNTTYDKIRTRAAEIIKEREEDGNRGGEEQIQLHAVDPSTQITITIPPPIPSDLSENSATPPPAPEEILARRTFESFPPNLQKALELGSLDEVNKVLGRMSVEEAEEVVEKLGSTGMLNLEEKVIDATTEDGKRLVEEIERSGKLVAGGDGGLGEVQGVPSQRTKELKLEDTVD